MLFIAEWRIAVISQIHAVDNALRLVGDLLADPLPGLFAAEDAVTNYERLVRIGAGCRHMPHIRELQRFSQKIDHFGWFQLKIFKFKI